MVIIMKYKVLSGFVKDEKGGCAKVGSTINITDKKFAANLLHRGKIKEIKENNL